MVRTINEVLKPEEIQSIEKFNKDMCDPYSAWILNKALHIECVAVDEKIDVSTFESVKRTLPRKKQKEYSELAKIRRNYLQKRNLRELILTNELRLREQDIYIHKYFLSEKMGYDVGLLASSAHWLREQGKMFYDASTAQLAEEDMAFQWEGLEKAIVVLNYNQEKQQTCYVVAFKEDVMLEEGLAQVIGGVTKDLLKVTERARIVREKLSKIYLSHHFLILK